jgi:hypothetical protein
MRDGEEPRRGGNDSWMKRRYRRPGRTQDSPMKAESTATGTAYWRAAGCQQ